MSGYNIPTSSDDLRNATLPFGWDQVHALFASVAAENRQPVMVKIGFLTLQDLIGSPEWVLRGDYTTGGQYLLFGYPIHSAYRARWFEIITTSTRVDSIRS